MAGDSTILFQQCRTNVSEINNAASNDEADVGEIFCFWLVRSRARRHDSAADPPPLDVAISIARVNASVLALVVIRDTKSCWRRLALENDSDGTRRRDSTKDWRWTCASRPEGREVEVDMLA